jgi:DNA end-binding protein Ku
MPRAIWRGDLAVGLIKIPVALHQALLEKGPQFRLLHGPDGSPIRMEHVCEEEARPVPWEEVARGFEYEKGKYVVLSPDEIREAALARSTSMDVLDFVPRGDVDPRYFDTPYYLLPQPGGRRAYVILREALREADRLAVGKLVLRDAGRLVAIGVIGEALALWTLRYASEIIDPAALPLPREEHPRDEDVHLMRALIERLGDRFRPDKYIDEYRQNLRRLIRAKLRGKRVRLPAPQAAAPQGEVVGLMERLEQSLRQQAEREEQAAASA